LQDNGAAYEAGGLEVGQLILEVDGQKVEGKASRVQILLEAASTKRTKDTGMYSDCHGGNRTSLTNLANPIPDKAI
jgi:C-terminal processing protease CtpA/Prc